MVSSSCMQFTPIPVAHMDVPSNTEGENVRDQATRCGIRGIASAEDGTACFREFGFTAGCAAVWNYNTQTTQQFCIEPCSELFSQDLPTNGPPPICALHECIECDEIYAGPVFLQYAGRTRRNSGLISGIARNCSELILVPQVDPCAAFDRMPESIRSPTSEPIGSPTTDPTLSPTSASAIGSFSLWGGNLALMASWMLVLW